MKATAVRTTPTSFTHRVEIRQHRLRADEPAEQGGDDEGPTPQELLAVDPQELRAAGMSTRKGATCARSRSASLMDG